MEPALFDQAGVNTESKIKFFLPLNPTLQFSVTIEATILACEVDIASFWTNAYSLGYDIGTRDFAYKLPKAV